MRARPAAVRWRESWHRRVASGRADEGSALVEFLGVTVLVMIPLVYLILALAQVQAGMYAAEAASRTAARSAAVAGALALDDGASRGDAWGAALAHGHASVDLTADDFGAGAMTLELECDGTCLEPGTDVIAEVTATVALPGVPSAVLAIAPLAVDVSARGVSPVDGLAP